MFNDQAGNTTPSTSNYLRESLHDSAATRGGEDWYEVHMRVLSDVSWLQIKKQLADAQIAARNMKRRVSEDLIAFGKHKVTVMPDGLNLGSRRRGLYLSYRFQIDGIDIAISDRRHDGSHVAHAVAPGRVCAAYGFAECRRIVHEVLGCLNCRIEREHLSRVDMCLSLPGVGIDAFVDAHLDRRVVTRTRTRQLFESTGKTIAYGKSPIRMQLYEGARSARANADGRADVLRVEFQLRREYLRRHGVDSPADYLRLRAELVSYLVEHWIRFTDGPVDPVNTSRSRVHPLWKRVADGFKNWAGDPSGGSLLPLPSQRMEPHRYVQQALGCLITAMSMQGVIVVSREQFLNMTRQLVEEQLEQVDLEAAFYRRKNSGVGR